MAQGWPKAGLAVAMLAALAVLGACQPFPQPFDHSGGELRRPAAHGGTYPYERPQPRARDTEAFDPYAVAPAKVVKVGLLLPLSGRSEKVGKALRDAAVLALFDKYATLRGPQAAIRVELISKDTGGSPEGAQQAAAEAMREGAQLLIGPLFSRSVEALKPLAATGKVTILSFSNNQDVAGDGVYVLGFNPAEQAERVAEYTFRRDISTVAVLAPRDAYGRQVIKAFEHEATLLGRHVKPVIRYSAAGSTLNQDIRTLARDGTQGARFTFGGLFLPEGGNKLGPILSGLAAMNITPQTVQFIGTGLWDDKDLIRRHNLNGAWLASSPPALYDAFEQRFRSSYDYKPPRIASLAYDAVALAATIATEHQGFPRSAFADPSGFSGPANGIFRFRNDGTTERGLAVLQVDGQQFTVVDPAPMAFR